MELTEAFDKLDEAGASVSHNGSIGNLVDLNAEPPFAASRRRYMDNVCAMFFKEGD